MHSLTKSILTNQISEKCVTSSIFPTNPINSNWNAFQHFYSHPSRSNVSMLIVNFHRWHPSSDDDTRPVMMTTVQRWWHPSSDDDTHPTVVTPVRQWWHPSDSDDTRLMSTNTRLNVLFPNCTLLTLKYMKMIF